MNDRADELIETLEAVEDDEALVHVLKAYRHLLFFHMSLINDRMEVLYDSHMQRQLGVYASHVFDKIPPDIVQALSDDVGCSEERSPLLGQKLLYLAKCFDFHDKRYILRLAFPFEYIQELKKNFQGGFLVLSAIILFLFSALTVIILYTFMGPVRQIIRAITPYNEGAASFIPEIHIRAYLKDEFSDLAKTFNSLSQHIQQQIATLTHERNEKEITLQSLVEGVVALDSNMNVSYANDMAIKLLALTSDAIGKPLASLGAAESLTRAYELLHSCRQHNKCVSSELHIELGGKKMHLNIIAAPRENQGAILVVQDISIHYRILEMRKDFIANASHELKTPITIIRGFAETLHDNPELDHNIVREITQKICHSSHRMTKIIKNLLTLADIENLRDFSLQECAVINLVENCRHALISLYPDAVVTIDMQSESECSIQADPELLEVALMNLFENAVKYSKENANITVHIKKHEGHLQIAVQDRGIGIPERDLEQIFQRFYTVNKAESKRKGGSGLGLSIVETIIEKHFGSICVTSEVGVGSTFTITLPENTSPHVS